MNNAQEWSREFDLHYNNADNSAPYLNTYEKSIYLTTAQDEIVKDHYSGKNQYLEGFENSEHIRRGLDILVNRISLIPSSLYSTIKLSPNNVLIELPNGHNIWFIVNEFVTLKDETCSPKNIIIIPKTHDDYYKSMRNPFIQPNNRRIFRLDVSHNNKRFIELATTLQVREYNITYLREPSPIIIDDISDNNPDYYGLNNTIKGRNQIVDCELNSNFHNVILDRAVELAIRDYKESNLSNQIQTHTRNF